MWSSRDKEDILEKISKLSRINFNQMTSYRTKNYVLIDSDNLKS